MDSKQWVCDRMAPRGSDKLLRNFIDFLRIARVALNLLPKACSLICTLQTSLEDKNVCEYTTLQGGFQTGDRWKLYTSMVMSCESPLKSLSFVKKSMQWHSCVTRRSNPVISLQRRPLDQGQAQLHRERTFRSRMGTHGQFQNPWSASACSSS